VTPFMGFLYGLTLDRPLPICGEIGSLCAAEIISHVGARPELELEPLVVPARPAPSPGL
jgi:sugar/nucleoside kinase (ribokinase family)